MNNTLRKLIINLLKRFADDLGNNSCNEIGESAEDEELFEGLTKKEIKALYEEFRKSDLAKTGDYEGMGEEYDHFLWDTQLVDFVIEKLEKQTN